MKREVWRRKGREDLNVIVAFKDVRLFSTDAHKMYITYIYMYIFIFITTELYTKKNRFDYHYSPSNAVADVTCRYLIVWSSKTMKTHVHLLNHTCSYFICDIIGKICYDKHYITMCEPITFFGSSTELVPA